MIVPAVVDPPYDRLLWGAATIVAALLISRALKLIVARLEGHRPDEERELLRLRRGETAIALIVVGFGGAAVPDGHHRRRAARVRAVVRRRRLRAPRAGAVSGMVEQFGLRSTLVRSLNGDRTYVPNSQIVAATRSPRGYRTYSIELLTSDPEEARRAIVGVGRRAPVGEARFLRPPRVIDERELGASRERGRAEPVRAWEMGPPAHCFTLLGGAP